MISNPAERVRELEAELAAERARVSELRHVLAAMGVASAIVSSESILAATRLLYRVRELEAAIGTVKREAAELEAAIADAGYRPEPNAAVEGADAPEAA